MPAQHSRMRMPWKSEKASSSELANSDQPGLFDSKPITTGEPLIVAAELVDEDPNNPRTKFVEAEIEELAEDIRQRGILQPIVVGAADEAGHHRIRHGAKRLRAARRAGLVAVPVTIASSKPDAYAQVAENQKRHGLSPLDLARFIRSRADAGESNATIAKKLGMDQTSVAHHLALLSLPPVLDNALKSGRCTSPRTLHELSKLHEERPNEVEAALAADAALTRAAVTGLKAAAHPDAHGSACGIPSDRRRLSLPIDQAEKLCDRLGPLLQKISRTDAAVDVERLAALRKRLIDIAGP
jgi:ParB family transcriptional regulator, chromosome partitioning protein